MVFSIDIPCAEDAIEEILDRFGEKDDHGARAEEEADENEHFDEPADDDDQSGYEHFYLYHHTKLMIFL